MSNIAVITARGGSKRIPRKNIRNFCGKPIIAYSIEAAVESGLFDEVMVSTDDDEIADISKKYGANVPFFRSAETSDDYATTRDVLIEVLNTYKKLGSTFDHICCIYPTAPFVTSQKLRDSFEVLRRSGTDGVEPVVKFGYPPQRGFTIDENGCLKCIHPEYSRSRSQDLEPIYHDAGQFYWYKVEECFFSRKDSFNLGTIVLPENEVQDIDTESDWILAELKYKLWKESGNLK